MKQQAHVTLKNNQQINCFVPLIGLAGIVGIAATNSMAHQKDALLAKQA